MDKKSANKASGVYIYIDLEVVAHHVFNGLSPQQRLLYKTMLKHYQPESTILN